MIYVTSKCWSTIGNEAILVLINYNPHLMRFDDDVENNFIRTNFARKR